MPLGNTEAVKRAQAGEKKAAPAKSSPARETAAKRASTPETPEAKPAPRKLTDEEEFDARLRKTFPDLTDAELKYLRDEFLKK